jgi:hypothetical protein
LYGYETLSLILRKKHRLRVFVNRVLRRIFGLERKGAGVDSLMRSVITCVLHHISLW